MSHVTYHVTCMNSASPARTGVPQTNELRDECEWVTWHVNESCYTWMSHVTYHFTYQDGKSQMIEFAANKRVAWQVRTSHETYEWVMLHIHESWHKSFQISIRQVTHDWVCRKQTSCVTSANESRDIWMSHVTREWVMAHPSCHFWMWRVTNELVVPQTDASGYTYEWVMSHTQMSHVTYRNESWHICEWVMSHIWMSRAANRCVMSYMSASCHTWMSHVTYEWVMSHTWHEHRLFSRIHVLSYIVNVSSFVNAQYA